jgi:hypothetical protein
MISNSVPKPPFKPAVCGGAVIPTVDSIGTRKYWTTPLPASWVHRPIRKITPIRRRFDAEATKVIQDVSFDILEISSWALISDISNTTSSSFILPFALGLAGLQINTLTGIWRVFRAPRRLDLEGPANGVIPGRNTGHNRGQRVRHLGTARGFAMPRRCLQESIPSRTLSKRTELIRPVIRRGFLSNSRRKLSGGNSRQNASFSDEQARE